MKDITIYFSCLLLMVAANVTLNKRSKKPLFDEVIFNSSKYVIIIIAAELGLHGLIPTFLVAVVMAVVVFIPIFFKK